eukprot:SM002452S08220  [mRNA]  locus=s2452:1113:1761:+ [translate_table: standard]
MRLSLSVQRSQALALHQRAGRALSQASGFRGGAPPPQVSLSDLFVITPRSVGHPGSLCRTVRDQTTEPGLCSSPGRWSERQGGRTEAAWQRYDCFEGREEAGRGEGGGACQQS